VTGILDGVKTWTTAVLGLVVLLAATAALLSAGDADVGDVFFRSGGWSIGVWLTAVIGFGAAYLSAVYLGHLGRGAIWVLFVFGAPIAAMIFSWILIATVDPEPGCTEECWGRLWLVVVAGIGLLGWFVGLIAGGVHRLLDRRSRSTPRSRRR